MFFRLLSKGIVLVAVLFALFQFVLPVYAFLPALQARALHLAFMFFMIFIPGALRAAADKGGVKKLRPAVFRDLLMGAAGLGISLYVFFDYSRISDQYGVPSGPLQIAAALVLTLLILEAARR